MEDGSQGDPLTAVCPRVVAGRGGASVGSRPGETRDVPLGPHWAAMPIQHSRRRLRRQGRWQLVTAHASPCWEILVGGKWEILVTGCGGAWLSLTRYIRHPPPRAATQLAPGCWSLKRAVHVVGAECPVTFVTDHPGGRDERMALGTRPALLRRCALTTRPSFHRALPSCIRLARQWRSVPAPAPVQQ
eukprot:scaffold16716_cov134-Isochrysis_galbana.AAC.3